MIARYIPYISFTLLYLGGGAAPRRGNILYKKYTFFGIIIIPK